jgi:small subunit ribosomal protein S2
MDVNPTSLGLIRATRGEKDTAMRNVTLEELLEAGCHFGHQVTRQNPKSRDFVFEARDNIHIIDLEKTKEGLDAAGEFVRNLAKRNGTMVMLGAKRQAEQVVKDGAKRAQEVGADGLFFVTQRWIGGIFTNYPEVSKNFRRLSTLKENLSNEYERAKFTKKEISLWEKERAKLENFYGGISEMKSPPDAIFIIDTHLEDLAVREARAKGVTIVGITDTNSDPTIIDYPIPANDDALGSIELIANYIIDAWIEGRKMSKDENAKGEEQSGKKDTKKADELKETKKEDPKEVKKETKEKVSKKPLTEKKDAEKAKKTVTKKTIKKTA